MTSAGDDMGRCSCLYLLLGVVVLDVEVEVDGVED